MRPGSQQEQRYISAILMRSSKQHISLFQTTFVISNHFSRFNNLLILSLFIALTNLSTALILGATSFLLMFISRVKVSHLSLLILLSGFISAQTTGRSIMERVDQIKMPKDTQSQIKMTLIKQM